MSEILDTIMAVLDWVAYNILIPLVLWSYPQLLRLRDFAAANLDQWWMWAIILFLLSGVAVGRKRYTEPGLYERNLERGYHMPPNDLRGTPVRIPLFYVSCFVIVGSGMWAGSTGSLMAYSICAAVALLNIYLSYAIRAMDRKHLKEDGIPVFQAFGGDRSFHILFSLGVIGAAVISIYIGLYYI